MNKVKPRDKKAFKKIEEHLKNYRNYLVGIRNMRKQLDHILPNITANYEISEGTVGTFTFKSSTEDFAIDRIEGKRALQLHEDIAIYQLIIDNIMAAVEELEKHEQDFVKYRYFNNWTMQQVSMKMMFSERNLFFVRNNVRDKLMISLKHITKLEV